MFSSEDKTTDLSMVTVHAKRTSQRVVQLRLQLNQCLARIPSQSSVYLHPCTVQLRPLTYLCKQTWNIHCNECQQLTPFWFRMSVPTLQHSMVQHDHKVTHGALDGILIHLYCRHLLFSCTNFVPLHELNFCRRLPKQ